MRHAKPLGSDLADAKRMLRDAIAAQGGPSVDYDVDAWVEEWILRPQPALGGVCPSTLLQTEEGLDRVRRLLGAIISGAFQ